MEKSEQEETHDIHAPPEPVTHVDVNRYLLLQHFRDGIHRTGRNDCNIYLQSSKEIVKIVITASRNSAIDCVEESMQ